MCVLFWWMLRQERIITDSRRSHANSTLIIYTEFVRRSCLRTRIQRRLLWCSTRCRQHSRIFTGKENAMLSVKIFFAALYKSFLCSNLWCFNKIPNFVLENRSRSDQRNLMGILYISFWEKKNGLLFDLVLGKLNWVFENRWFIFENPQLIKNDTGADQLQRCRPHSLSFDLCLSTVKHNYPQSKRSRTLVQSLCHYMY